MDYYYNIAGFLNDEEVHKVWNIVGDALERQGYNVDNGELSIRVYDEELTENVEHCDDDYLSSLSEGKDNNNLSVPVDEVTTIHRRKDLDLL